MGDFIRRIETDLKTKLPLRENKNYRQTVRTERHFSMPVERSYHNFHKNKAQFFFFSAITALRSASFTRKQNRWKFLSANCAFEKDVASSKTKTKKNPSCHKWEKRRRRDASVPRPGSFHERVCHSEIFLQRRFLFVKRPVLVRLRGKTAWGHALWTCRVCRELISIT